MDNVIHGIEFYRQHPTYVKAALINGQPMWKGVGRVWMTYHETRRFGRETRQYVRYRVEANGKFYSPLATLIEIADAPPTKAALTAREMAAQQHPDFNWSRYDQLEHEAAQAAIRKLNHRPLAPLGREEPKPEMKYDNRTEFEKMSDNAIQQTGKELVAAQQVGIQTKEDMIKAVKVAYSANTELKEAHVMALALLCWELGLSPNPGLGHAYGWIKGGKFHATVGIYGLINLARRDHEFILKDARDMTNDERKREGLKPEDIGVMVGIIDMREARNAGELAKLGVGVNINDLVHWVPGIWFREVNWDAEKKVWKGDNIPAGWTARMVAEKRATRLALKRLGLNSNVGKLPKIDGYQYDSEEGTYIEENPQITGGESAPAPEQPEPPVEAVFEEMLATQVETEQARESAAAEQAEGAEVVDETPEPATSEPAPAAAEVVDEKPAETPAPEKKERPKSDRPYPPAQFKPKFQTAVNAYLGNHPDTKAKITDTSVVEGWFAGLVDTPSDGIAFVKSFCEVEQLNDITQAQADILVGKILSKPEWAKVEIEQYVKAFLARTAEQAQEA